MILIMTVYTRRYVPEFIAGDLDSVYKDVLMYFESKVWLGYGYITYECNTIFQTISSIFSTHANLFFEYCVMFTTQYFNLKTS